MIKNFLITTFRTLKRSKAYFLLSVTGLSLGISCVVALYTIVNFQSSFDSHQEHRETTYRIVGNYKIGDDEGKTATVPHPLANGVRDELVGVEAISNLYLLSDQINVIEAGEIVKKIKQDGIAFAQPDVFKILSFNWLSGSISIDNPTAVYISKSTAEKFYGGNMSYSEMLGKTLVLGNTHTLNISGIFEDLPLNTDFPFEMIASYEKQEGVNPYFGEGKIWGRLNGGTQCLLKLNKGTSPEQAEVSLNQAFEKHNNVEGYKLELQPFRDIHIGEVNNYSGINFQPKYKMISLTLAVFLALIGSINFINLTTARSVKRAREVGIRKVMGGRRLELMIQFMMETFIIVFISLAAGFILGEQILMLFNSMLGMRIGISSVLLADWLVFSTVVLAGMTLISGLYPALVLSRFSALTAIKIKISNIDKQSKFPLRKVLVGLQFGFSISLIIGAIVIFSQTSHMKNHDMGFSSDNIMNLRFPTPDFEKQSRLKRQLESLPQIEKASLNLGSPIASTNNTDKFFNPTIGKEESFTINSKSVDENYLDLFEIELLAGRNLTASDPRENIVITEIAISKFNLGSPIDAIGQELESTYGRRAKIVGVVRDFNANSLQSELMPVMMSYAKGGFFEIALKLSQTGDDPSEVLAKIEDTWDSVYPELLVEYGFLDDQIAQRYEFENIMAKSIGFFVVIALIISILGLYGLTDYMANAKRKEIGIRKVVGAEIPQILLLFAKEVAFLLLIAFLISASASYWLMNNWLESFEYHITIGWEVLVGALLMTMFIAVLTMGSRSLAAARINPVIVLKDE